MEWADNEAGAQWHRKVINEVNDVKLEDMIISK